MRHRREIDYRIQNAQQVITRSDVCNTISASVSTAISTSAAVTRGISASISTSRAIAGRIAAAISGSVARGVVLRGLQGKVVKNANKEGQSNESKKPTSSRKMLFSPNSKIHSPDCMRPSLWEWYILRRTWATMSKPRCIFLHFLSRHHFFSWKRRSPVQACHPRLWTWTR